VATLTKREIRRRPRKRRTFELTDAERAQVRRGLRVIRERFGTWEALARAVGCAPDTLARAASVTATKRWALSPALTLRTAQAAGVPAEDLLSGAWLKGVPCPLCGHVE
jgi:hypothetical protein